MTALWPVRRVCLLFEILHNYVMHIVDVLQCKYKIFALLITFIDVRNWYGTIPNLFWYECHVHLPVCLTCLCDVNIHDALARGPHAYFACHFHHGNESW